MAPTLAIAANAASKAEGNAGNTPFTFTVTRSGDLTGASSANFAVAGTANATDFGGVLPSGTVSFAIGASTATITINVAGDTTVEGDEGFTVTLSSPTGATITTASASSTILNDDATLSIAADATSKSEGNAGNTPFTFTVTRTGDLTGTASAAFAVTGTANATDFAGGVLPSGTVSFAAGAATATITVNVLGDTAVEVDESFTVTLSSPTGATITTAAASSTVLNDDASLSIAADAASKAEGNAGNTPFTFTVTRTGILLGASSASYAVSGAANAADFGGVLPSGTVSFAAGQSSAVITVNVSGDTTVEGDESFTVTLSSPVGATITTAAASSIIVNDDTVVSLRTIGEAGVFSRANPNAWRDAWLKDGVQIAHRQVGSNVNEAWLAANFGTAGPGIYGGSDLANGDLGVAGRTGGTQPVPQEIDGTEALRFVFLTTMSVLDFGFAAFDLGDRASIEAFNSSGALVGSLSATSASARLDGLVGATSVIVRSELGSFNVDKLSFG